MLAAQHRSPEEFADIVRRELELRQMDGQLTASAFVTDADVSNYVRLRDQTRDFRFLKIEKPSVADVKIADADIDAYYKAHASDFMTPEKISLDYVELDASKMKVATSVDDATLKKLYEDQKSRFIASEQRLASHILVKVDKNAKAAAPMKSISKMTAEERAQLRTDVVKESKP